MDGDRNSVEARGVRAARSFGRFARLAALRAFRNADADPVSAAVREIKRIQPLLVDAMVLGHLKGRNRTAMQAARADKTVRLARGDGLISAYKGAVSLIQSQLELSDSQVDGLRSTYSDDVADSVAVLAKLVDGKLGEAMVRITEQGLSLRSGLSELRKAFKAAGIEPANSFTLENLFRTQTQLSYAAGRWQALREPVVDEILWGFTYSTVGDSRVRPTHSAMDGIRLPKDHPFWKSAFPPNGYSCRCTAVEVFKGESQARPDRVVLPTTREIDGVMVEPIADRGFQFNPGEVFSAPQIAA